jgi:hypothetical protein
VIIVVAGDFPIYDQRGVGTGRTESVASHGIDYTTGRSIVLPSESPLNLGAEVHEQLNEWVLYDSDLDRTLHERLCEN